MIRYRPGKWGVRYIFHLNGSVFPKAFFWAAPAALAAILAREFLFEKHETNAPHNVSNVTTTVFSSFTYVLGFLVVFRTQQAYSRYWEGVSLVQVTRGQWFNAASSLVAFCTADPEKKDKVEQFQHLLIRLISILHCTALQQIADVENDENWKTIDRSGIDIPSMSYLATKSEKCEIIFLWIQRLIIANTGNGVLCAAPPILSRVFQDLSLGIVNINNAKKINEVPFPFPYAQMVTVMLLLFTFMTPLALAYYCSVSATAGLLSFIAISIYWCINYIAAELEMPFGSDANDLPMVEFQNRMNMSLTSLLDEHAQIPPTFDLVNKKPVKVMSPMSWQSDDNIVPPQDSNIDSAESRRWQQALESRKQHIIVDTPDAVGGSLKALQSTMIAATTQAVQRTLSIPHLPRHHHSRHIPNSEGEPQEGEHQVNRVKEHPYKNALSFNPDLNGSSTDLACPLQAIAKDVNFLVELGKQWPGAPSLTRILSTQSTPQCAKPQTLTSNYPPPTCTSRGDNPRTLPL